MEVINEIKIPKGVKSISVKQHDDKVVIEFMPKKPKFKVGDKVRIKDGISSKTHRFISPGFTGTMDEFIGKELTVKRCIDDDFVLFNEDEWGSLFVEDWLEPYTEELKKGDLAIFWDNYNNDNECALIRMYDRNGNSGYYDSCGTLWDNAIKFESKEQFEKILKGED